MPSDSFAALSRAARLRHGISFVLAQCECRFSVYCSSCVNSAASVAFGTWFGVPGSAWRLNLPSSASAMIWLRLSISAATAGSIFTGLGAGRRPDTRAVVVLSLIFFRHRLSRHGPRGVCVSVIPGIGRLMRSDHASFPGFRGSFGVRFMFISFSQGGFIAFQRGWFWLLFCLRLSTGSR